MFTYLDKMFPLRCMPTLVFDGVVITQQLAIIRYLANAFDLYGSNNMEGATIDQKLQTVKEIFDAFFRKIKAYQILEPQTRVSVTLLTHTHTYTKSVTLLTHTHTYTKSVTLLTHTHTYTKSVTLLTHTHTYTECYFAYAYTYIHKECYFAYAYTYIHKECYFAYAYTYIHKECYFAYAYTYTKSVTLLN